MVDIQLHSYTRKDGEINPGYEQTEKAIQIPVEPSNVIVESEAQPSPTIGSGDNSVFRRQVEAIRIKVATNLERYKKPLCYGFRAVLVIFYFVYFGAAMAHRFGDEGSIRLLWITCVVVAIICLRFLMKKFGPKMGEATAPCTEKVSPHSTRISWMVVAVLGVGICVFAFVDIGIRNQPYNLVSLSGIAVYLLLFFIFSTSPAQITWRPVVWGIVLQFVFALLVLRTSWGRTAFSWLGERVKEFLDHADAGSRFVFGDKFMDHPFAFKVLPIIIFFSAAISVVYHLGIMQVIILKMAFFTRLTMKTSGPESVVAIGNIFIGMSEVPFMIKPFLPQMTASALHTVMTCGFASVAGGVLGAYIAMGIPAGHLLAASVMSAPAALAMSKLVYPETEKRDSDSEVPDQLHISEYRNVIEAAFAGAAEAIRSVASIAANLIAFIAVLTFINATLTWFGIRIGIQPPEHPYLTFQLISSYVLYPFAMIMGVNLPDCRKVAELIGVKTFLNEFIAFQQLSVLINNRAVYSAYNGTVIRRGDDLFLEGINRTLVGGILTERSEVISTYALCGFSNFASMGMQLGALGALLPHKKSLLAKIVLRAMIAGNVACFMTACIAGLFYTGR